jgi:hypothetical protein
VTSTRIIDLLLDEAEQLVSEMSSDELVRAAFRRPAWANDQVADIVGVLVRHELARRRETGAG